MKSAISLLFICLLSCNTQPEKFTLNFPEGGYDFAEQINHKDSSFPFHPVRSLESIRDSTFDAFYTKKLLEVFDEPNISLRPAAKPVFRILFSCGTCITYFIRIDEDRIIIKKGLRVDYLHKADKSLSEQEQQHLEILESGVPLSKRMAKARGPLQKKYFDSLTKHYPELFTEAYYNYLMEKSFIPLDKPFTYSTNIVSIRRSHFANIIKELTNAGYWKMPLRLDCNNPVNDGYQFLLESNSGRKYNIVEFGFCGDESTHFKMVCKALIKLAGLSNEIHL